MMTMRLGPATEMDLQELSDATVNWILKKLPTTFQMKILSMTFGAVTPAMNLASQTPEDTTKTGQTELFMPERGIKLDNARNPIVTIKNGKIVDTDFESSGEQIPQDLQEKYDAAIEVFSCPDYDSFEKVEKIGDTFDTDLSDYANIDDITRPQSQPLISKL